MKKIIVWLAVMMYTLSGYAQMHLGISRVK